MASAETGLETGNNSLLATRLAGHVAGETRGTRAPGPGGGARDERLEMRASLAQTVNTDPLAHNLLHKCTTHLTMHQLTWTLLRDAWPKS